MDRLSVIMERIETLMTERGLSASALSVLATDGRSKDLIRNWQRAVKEGREASARMDSIAQVAAALGVSDVWLATGLGPRDTLTEEERTMLAAYRAIDERVRARHLRAAMEIFRLGGTPEDTEEDQGAGGSLVRG